MTVKLEVRPDYYFYNMHPFQEKYHQTKGTHCWYCDREFGVEKSLRTARGGVLKITREHIIPKSKIIYNYGRNYVAACQDCNGLKGRKWVKEFAKLLTVLHKEHSPATHSMHTLFPMMITRSWKLYNKTKHLHENYLELRFANPKNKK